MKNLFNNLIYSEFFNKGTGGGASGGNVKYQSGYRINSSGEQIEYDGYATSDYISCELNNVVYLLNIYMKSGVENAGNLRIAFYDSDKVHLGQTNATGAGDNLNGKYEATDGSLSQFTVKSFTDCDLTAVKYFRLCSTKLGGDTVVIVSEAVESGGDTESYAITNFRNFCYGSSRIDELEFIDTSKGTDFYNMFSNCGSVKSIPKFDTSNGTNFDRMFYMCSSLESIPKLNVSKGTSFVYMFGNCKAMTSVPELNTCNGVNFEDMFTGCSNLTSISKLNTSNGTNFLRMFSSCTNLTTIPELDTSNGTKFARMFSSCTNLTTIPELDTSKCQDFEYMFSSCTNLTTIPRLDVTKAALNTSCSGMFSNCVNLTNLRLYNIRRAITVGSGTSYGHLLTVDSLVHTIKELCTATSSTTLSMGAANLEKIANLYCRIIDDSTEKIEMELCENADEGAMTLSEYASLKNWTFA